MVTHVWNCEACALPIDVYFQNGSSDHFTCGGKKHTENKYQSLFWDEVKIIAPKQPQRMKLIHGVEIPVFEFTPQIGEEFYTANVGLPEFFEQGYRGPVGCTFTQRMLKRGLLYPYTEEGKQAAILHAKAMLGIKE